MEKNARAYKWMVFSPLLPLLVKSRLGQIALGTSAMPYQGHLTIFDSVDNWEAVIEGSKQTKPVLFLLFFLLSTPPDVL